MEESIPVFTLDKETVELFTRTRDLLDQILETFEILEDKELMAEIVQAEEEYEKGIFVSLEEYKKGKRSFGQQEL